MAENSAIDDRIEKMEETEPYITVKDHKGFRHKLSFCLINPHKSDKGKLSKIQVDKINKILILSTNVNQWNSTRTAIDWFKNLGNKKQCSFVNFI